MNVSPTHSEQSAHSEKAGLEQQLAGITQLLLVQKRLREATSVADLGFILANDTRSLVSYSLAAVWLKKVGRHKPQGALVALSDVADFNDDAPQCQWLNDQCLRCVQQDIREAFSFSQTSDFYQQHSSQDWPDGFSRYGVWLPIIVDNEVCGGVLMIRPKPLAESEQHILNHVMPAASHSLLGLWGLPRFRRRRAQQQFFSKWRWIAALVLAGVLCLPVQLTVLAPAEVMPVEPMIVRSPLSGVIKTLAVTPNQYVKKGDVLLTLDDAELKTREQIAQQNLVIAKADYYQAQQAAFSDSKAKAKLQRLKLAITRQQQEVTYIETLLKRSQITADRDGIVMIPNTHSIVGKTVNLGERIFMLANPEATKLLMWLPVGENIDLELGSDIRLFLNALPDQYVPATLTYMGYQAQTRPEGGMAYEFHGEFRGEFKDEPNSSSQASLRVGQQGVARLEGQRVSLFYYLMRKPLAFLRQWIGL